MCIIIYKLFLYIFSNSLINCEKWGVLRKTDAELLLYCCIVITHNGHIHHS